VYLSTSSHAADTACENTDHKTTDMTLRLGPWFDMAKSVSKSDADLTQAQMMLHALKGGIDRDSADAKHRTEKCIRQ
jgi:hypothetical protein